MNHQVISEINSQLYMEGERKMNHIPTNDSSSSDDDSNVDDNTIETS